MRILNAAQMRAADQRTINDLGIPSLVLMENAGRQVVDAIESTFDDIAAARVIVLCGRGNNGGDGAVIARVLQQRGADVDILLFGRASEATADTRTNLDLAAGLGVPVTEILDEEAWDRDGPRIAACDFVVDALFGTGLNTALTGLLEGVTADINGAGVPVVSVDIPSGLSGDSPVPPGPCIRATLTVTLAAPKVPLVLAPAAAYVGELVVGDIGIPADVIDSLDGPRLTLVTRAALRTAVPVRGAETHKGDYGRVVIVGGSVGKTGAVRLAGLAALRSGAGLVTVAAPASCLDVVAAVPDYMTHPLPDAAGRVDGTGATGLVALACDVLAVGPGLGTGEGARTLVHRLLNDADGTPRPLILDADALNVCADDPTRLRGSGERPVVITPHPGEMARLTGTSVADIQADRVGAARRFATSHSVYVVLKGARSLVATPDGAVFINPTGNPGMATGGSGDVLTGVIAAWLGQVAPVETAVTLAVYLHGLAGDLAARSVGQSALIASDLVQHLGAAVMTLTGDNAT